MASGFSWPCRGFGPPTFKNSWFFAIFKTPAQPSAENSWFFAIFKSPARPSADFELVDLRKLMVFCDFQITLRTLGWSTFENSWFFDIFKSPARPSADFGLVDLRKLVVFCDFQIARATLCGLWAGRPSKTRGFLQFPNRPRDPLRSFAWLNRSRCGAARIFLRP